MLHVNGFARSRQHRLANRPGRTQHPDRADWLNPVEIDGIRTCYHDGDGFGSNHRHRRVAPARATTATGRTGTGDQCRDRPFVLRSLFRYALCHDVTIGADRTRRRHADRFASDGAGHSAALPDVANRREVPGESPVAATGFPPGGSRRADLIPSKSRELENDPRHCFGRRSRVILLWAIAYAFRAVPALPVHAPCMRSNRIAYPAGQSIVTPARRTIAEN